MKKRMFISAYFNADSDPTFHFNADSKPTFLVYTAPASEPDPTPWYESATTGVQTLQGFIMRLGLPQVHLSLESLWIST